MPRVKRGVTAHARHKKILDRAEGMSGSRKELFKVANEAVMHALAYQYRDRRVRKRDMRRLWIARINAAARINGMTYSTFTFGLKAAGVEIDRKVLADMAVKDQVNFTRLVDVARTAAAKSAPAAVGASASASVPVKASASPSVPVKASASPSVPVEASASPSVPVED